MGNYTISAESMSMTCECYSKRRDKARQEQKVRELLEQKRRARGVSPAPPSPIAFLHTPLPDEIEVIDSADDTRAGKIAHEYAVNQINQLTS